MPRSSQAFSLLEGSPQKKKKNRVSISFLPHTCHMPRPPHTPGPGHRIFCEQYQPRSSSLCNFLLRTHIFISTVFSSTLNLCFSIHRASDTYNTNGKNFLISFRLYKNVLTLCKIYLVSGAGMPRVKLYPLPSCNKTGYFCFERKYEYKGAYLTFRGPCIVIYSYNESQRDALFLRSV